MYRRILVALDGSELAERALPHAEALAERSQGSVTLLRATLPLERIAATTAVLESGGTVDPAGVVKAERAEATGYLEDVADRLRGRGVEVGWEQPEDDPAEAIIACARLMGADLIAMTTHGRGGLARLVFGSVADAVLRQAPCPVLLVRADEAASHTAQG